MLFEVVPIVVLSVALAAPYRCGQGEHVFMADSSGVRFMNTATMFSEPAILYSQTLEAALATDIALVPDVRHILVERADDNLLVWIALDNPSKDVREKVFQKQFDLIDGFPEVSFDFNLVSAKDRAPEEFASSAKLIYSRSSR